MKKNAKENKKDEKNTKEVAEKEENIIEEKDDVCADAPAKDELSEAKEQIAALSDKLIRNAAEFDNFKKRTAREKDDFYKMAVCETVAPLLPVLDNLKRAVSAASDGDSGILDGVKMIEKQFNDALKGIGVEEIKSVGEQFDPEKHNAVMTADSDEEENTILEEFQTGYEYKGKVIRHSMVKVSN